MFHFFIYKNDQVFISKHRYRSLKKNSFTRAVFLFIPVFGNLIIAIYDFKKLKEADFALKILQLNGLALSHYSKKQKKDKKIVRTAVEENIAAFKEADPVLRNDPQFVSELMSNNCAVFCYAGDNLRNDMTFIADKTTYYGFSILEYADRQVQDDEKFVTLLLARDISALKFAKNLRQKSDFVLSLADKLDPAFFRCAHKCLRKDLAFVKKLMSVDISFLKYSHRDVKACKVFMQEVMVNHPETLQYSPLRKSKEFVAQLMKKELSIVKYACDEIRNDKIFFSQFKEENFKVYKYAGPQLQRKKSFIKEGIVKYRLSLRWLEEALKSREDILLLFVENGAIDELKWAAEEIKKSSLVAMRFSQINGGSLIYFDPAFADNKPLLQVAVKTSLVPLNNISAVLKKDSEFFLDLIEINAKSYLFADQELQQDVCFFMGALNRTMKVLPYAPFAKDKQRYESFVLERLSDAKIISYLDDSFRNSAAFIEKAMKINLEAFAYAGNDLRNNIDFILKYIKKDMSWKDRSRGVKENLERLKPYIKPSLLTHPLISILELG